MKYSFLAVALAALALTACDGKKHPMDKPPPSASVERESAPNFDELDKPSTGGAAGAQNDHGRRTARVQFNSDLVYAVERAQLLGDARNTVRACHPFHENLGSLAACCLL